MKKLQKKATGFIKLVDRGQRLGRVTHRDRPTSRQGEKEEARKAKLCISFHVREYGDAEIGTVAAWKVPNLQVREARLLWVSKEKGK